MTRFDTWRQAAPHYQATWQPVTGLFVPTLLDGANVRPGLRLLDLACGPGAVAEEALRRGCKVAGADYVVAMVRLARARLPRARFVAADAHTLPFAPRLFDAVAINFGVHHFADPAAVLSSVATLLCPGGRVAYTIWAGPEENPALEAIDGAFAAGLGDDRSAGPEVDLPFGDPARCRDALARVGYDSRTMELARVTRHWRPERPEEVFEAELRGGGRKTELLARQTPAVRDAIRAAVTETVHHYASAAGIAIPMTAHVISAGPTAAASPEPSS